ncbi:MAG: hypothetical protein LQ348_006586 [Seirophora lacunosa]|nr:MAG: hypothetical protein LQ344_001896 [Seirophora lacunosa]KAI4173455.1 MAG: hypothetical protein LQ348_006586 [Seirophora lacunosa]
MASRPIVYRHYQRALAQWPIDVLRPQVSFQGSMRRRIEKQFGPSNNDKTAYDPSKESKDTLVTPLKPSDEGAELDQVNVLYSFLEDRYSKKYPLSDRLMKPLSDPEHYEKIIKELEEAPNRSWFGSMVNRWKGMIRWS